MKILFAILLVCLAAVGVLSLLWRKNHPLWGQLERFRYAHRGYHDGSEAVENSMTAFRRAAERGWGVELDVHLMKDGNLAVIHDASLKRTAGADVTVEDLTREELAEYRLLHSGEAIPLLEEVLELFRDKGALIVELKAEKGNHNALAEAVWQRLKDYEGLYCIESFDPRVLAWFRKNAPRVLRGQLATDFVKERNGLSLPLAFALTHLLLNVYTRPDFVAYEFKSREKLALRLNKKCFGVREVNWTIRSREDMLAAEAMGNLVIFEYFDPEKA